MGVCGGMCGGMCVVGGCSCGCSRAILTTNATTSVFSISCEVNHIACESHNNFVRSKQ